jgi:hypothetical protein
MRWIALLLTLALATATWAAPLGDRARHYLTVATVVGAGCTGTQVIASVVLPMLAPARTAQPAPPRHPLVTLVETLLSLLTLALAWALAGRLVLYRAWNAQGRPGRFAGHVVRAAAPITLISLLVSLPFLVLLAAWRLFSHSAMPTEGIVLLFAASAALFFPYYHVMRRVAPSIFSLELRAGAWLAAVLAYAAITTGVGLGL